MSDRVTTFVREREERNAQVLASADLVVKRFFHLDARAYQDGALPRETKELLGLVASLVLRCDDCVSYHLLELAKLRVPREQVQEALGVGLVVGGSIVIPHLRRAVAFLEEAAPAAPEDPEPREGP